MAAVRARIAAEPAWQIGEGEIETGGSREQSIRAAFRRQAKACRDLNSPFTADLLSLLAAGLDRQTAIGREVLDWPGEPRADALALRLAGGLHALVLTGAAPALSAVYPGGADHQREGALQAALEAALATRSDALSAFIQSPPQTNEVARAAVLASGFLAITAASAKPLALIEIGASAGLNLALDRFRIELGGVVIGPADAAVHLAPSWEGPPPPDTPFAVASRAGCDRAPIDPTSPAAGLRLRAYIWPDQTARLERLEAALATAAWDPVRVEAADAVEWLAPRLERPASGVVTVVYHSIVWQYLGAAMQQHLQAMIEAAGRRATREAPLAWLRMEPGPDNAAELRLTLWPAGRDIALAAVHYHCRWIRWAEDEERLKALTTPTITG
jgi:hypothetical protein